MISQAMIFSAGLGKRMLPLTKNTPKPLIEINNKSLLKNNIEKLIESKFKNIVVNAYHHSEKIINETKMFKSVKVIVEAERLETGGGLLNAINEKCFRENTPIVLLNGDIFWYDKKYKSIDKIISLWNPHKMDMLLCLKRKEDFFGYNGNGDFDLQSDKFSSSKLEIKKNPLYAYTGLQIIKQDIIKDIKKNCFSLKEQILKSLEKNKLFGYIDENQWFHIGTVEDLKKFKENYCE